MLVLYKILLDRLVLHLSRVALLYGGVPGHLANNIKLFVHVNRVVGVEMQESPLLIVKNTEISIQ